MMIQCKSKIDFNEVALHAYDIATDMVFTCASFPPVHFRIVDNTDVMVNSLEIRLYLNDIRWNVDIFRGGFDILTFSENHNFLASIEGAIEILSGIIIEIINEMEKG